MCIYLEFISLGNKPYSSIWSIEILRGDPSQILSYDISILNLGLGSFVGGILFSIDNSFNLSIIISILLAILSSLLLKGASHSENENHSRLDF